jgi:hypothetical protein
MMKKKIKKVISGDKEKIIENFCEHLRKGYSEYSYKDYDYRDVQHFASALDVKNGNTEQVDKIDKAFRESFYFWENIAVDMIKDDTKKFFFPVWIFYVKSRFHWGEKKRRKIPKNEIVNIDLKMDKQIKLLNEG